MKTLKELLKKDTGKSKPVVFAFGRLNPPTIGHQKLIERIITIAKRVKGLPVLYVSASQDKVKNPLTVKQKVAYLKKIYPRGITILPAIGTERTFMEILKNRFDKKYTDVYMIAGSDRVAEFKKLIKKSLAWGTSIINFPFFLNLCFISSALLIFVKCQPPLLMNFISTYFVFENKTSNLKKENFLSLIFLSH